jgi:succinyl-CoA:acetate CoA-transferase
MNSSLVMSQALRTKIMSADDAAALVAAGANVGMSGFTGSGYPKAVPLALARRIEAAHARGEPFRIGVWTGASTAPARTGTARRSRGADPIPC